MRGTGNAGQFIKLHGGGGGGVTFAGVLGMGCNAAQCLGGGG